jgi:O-antigen/teichoic acid export membrane protein
LTNLFLRWSTQKCPGHGREIRCGNRPWPQKARFCFITVSFITSPHNDRGRLGYWSAFLALLNIILLISDQGLNIAVKRYISAARDTDELGGIVRVTFALRLITSFLFTLAIALLIRPLLDLLGQPSYLALMQRSLLLIALYSIMEYFKYLFEALHLLRFTFVINVVEHGSKLILVIALFRGGDRFLAIVTAFTIAVAVAFAVGVILTVGQLRIFTSPAPPRNASGYLCLPTFLMSIGALSRWKFRLCSRIWALIVTGIYSAAKQVVIFQLSLAFSMGASLVWRASMKNSLVNGGFIILFSAPLTLYPYSSVWD